MNDHEFMNMEMAVEISDTIQFRQSRFDEPLAMSIKVVLFGYGDERRIARCISGDWIGRKAEMNQDQDGLPICPNCGSVATEDAEGWQLALVQQTEATNDLCDL
jgi:hypothetical protein